MSGSSKFFFIVSGIVSIILGIFLLLNPAINLMAFAWLFSIIFFVSAVSSIINYFMLPLNCVAAGISSAVLSMLYSVSFSYAADLHSYR